MRNTLAVFSACLALAFAAFAIADEKKEVKLEGKLVCTKCKLKETESCGNALVVEDKEKKTSTTYYLNDKGKEEKYHQCSGEATATVTGTVTEKDKKMQVSDAKVEKK